MSMCKKIIDRVNRRRCERALMEGADPEAALSRYWDLMYSEGPWLYFTLRDPDNLPREFLRKTNAPLDLARKALDRARVDYMSLDWDPRADGGKLTVELEESSGLSEAVGEVQIKITSKEGTDGFPPGRPPSPMSPEEAQKVMTKWSHRAPPRGKGYDKVHFELIYKGKVISRARMDLNQGEPVELKSRVDKKLAFVKESFELEEGVFAAGLKSMSDEELLKWHQRNLKDRDHNKLANYEWRSRGKSVWLVGRKKGLFNTELDIQPLAQESVDLGEGWTSVNLSMSDMVDINAKAKAGTGKAKITPALYQQLKDVKYVPRDISSKGQGPMWGHLQDESIELGEVSLEDLREGSYTLKKLPPDPEWGDFDLPTWEVLVGGKRIGVVSHEPAGFRAFTGKKVGKGFASKNWEGKLHRTKERAAQELVDHYPQFMKESSVGGVS